MVVAGFLVDWQRVANLARDWRALKNRLGLPPHAEVKWSLPRSHPVREALRRRGRTVDDLRAQVARFVGSRTEITCLAAVMRETRNVPRWKDLLGRRPSVREFYCEGLRYMIQRVAEEVVEGCWAGCVVICDTPELGKKPYRHGTLRRGPKIVEETYQEWYLHGVGVGPGRKVYSGPLAEIGFHPSVLISDATYHDLLQIADAVAGITAEWVSVVRDAGSPPWPTHRFHLVRRQFRSKHGKPEFWGDGLVLWPWDEPLWIALRRSLES